MRFNPQVSGLKSRGDEKRIGSVNLRFEGIDAPELHYQGTRQPAPLAEQARDFLTGQIGMNPVTYGPSGTTVAPPANDGQEQAGHGVWATDPTTLATVTTLDDIETQHTVYPKLFRRLSDYFREGNTGLADLPDWMEQQGENDEVWILSTMSRTHFDNVINIQPAAIALKHQPTDLVFVSRK